MTDFETNNLLKNDVAGGVIVSACKLGKQISLLSIVFFIAEILNLSKDSNLYLCLINLLLFFVCQINSLRLSLDADLFDTLYKSRFDMTTFDGALKVFYNNDKNNADMFTRWQGARKIFNFAIFCLILQALLIAATYIL